MTMLLIPFHIVGERERERRRERVNVHLTDRSFASSLYNLDAVFVCR